MNRYAHRFATPLGEMLAIVNAEGALLTLTFCGETSEAAPTPKADPDLIWDADRCAQVVRQVNEYFCGERQTFDLPLAAPGTEFQRRVWTALQEVPYGATVSYGELAKRLGNPQASRAVGRANATNPISVVVPCHRVIGKSGTLTGYAFGLTRKERLLRLERERTEA